MFRLTSFSNCGNLISNLVKQSSGLPSIVKARYIHSNSASRSSVLEARLHAVQIDSIATNQKLDQEVRTLNREVYDLKMRLTDLESNLVNSKTNNSDRIYKRDMKITITGIVGLSVLGIFQIGLAIAKKQNSDAISNPQI